MRLRSPSKTHEVFGDPDVLTIKINYFSMDTFLKKKYARFALRANYCICQRHMRQKPNDYRIEMLISIQTIKKISGRTQQAAIVDGIRGDWEVYLQKRLMDHTRYDMNNISFYH